MSLTCWSPAQGTTWWGTPSFWRVLHTPSFKQKTALEHSAETSGTIWAEGLAMWEIQWVLVPTGAQSAPKSPSEFIAYQKSFHAYQSQSSLLLLNSSSCLLLKQINKQKQKPSAWADIYSWVPGLLPASLQLTIFEAPWQLLSLEGSLCPWHLALWC